MTISEAIQIITEYNYRNDNAEVTSRYNIALGIITQSLRKGYTLTYKGKKELVDHPRHYNAVGKKECIIEMEERYGREAVADFCLLSAYKYLYRKDYKGHKVQDIDKAKWYLSYIETHLDPDTDTLALCKQLMHEIEIADI